MTQRQVVQIFGEDPGSHMGQRSDVEFPHTVAVHRFSTRSEKVPHGDDRDLHPQIPALLFRQGRNIRIVTADAFDQLALLVLDALSSFSHADIPVPQVGNGTDDQFR